MSVESAKEPVVGTATAPRSATAAPAPRQLRMLTSVPSPPGFGLDEHHQPHITTLQRYVRTADLDNVYVAIEGILASLDLSSLTLTAHGLAHMEVQPSIGVTAIVIKPSPEVLAFQASLIAALKPYTARGGTPDAYVRTEADPDINTPTLTYIENYVPNTVARTTSPTSPSVWRPSPT